MGLFYSHIHSVTGLIVHRQEKLRQDRHDGKTWGASSGGARDPQRNQDLWRLGPRLLSQGVTCARNKGSLSTFFLYPPRPSIPSLDLSQISTLN